MDVLPLEIYREIFKCLNQQDLQTCYVVSKSWYSKAIVLNWEEVTIKDSKIELMKSHLSNSDHDQYFKYGHLIKKLTIEISYRFMKRIRENPALKNKYVFNKPELLVLLSQLPNLNEIDIDNDNYTEEYFKTLLDSDLQHIKKINANYCTHFYDMSYPHPFLFLLHYKFRNTISCLNILYHQSTIRFNSQKINILDSLTQFKHLTELELNNTLDINLTPFHIQDMCPHLKRLHFLSNYSISDSMILRLLDRNSKINPNFIPSLTHLYLNLPSISTMYTRYLVDYFPNQCIEFILKIPQQNFFNWVDTVSMELALKLLEKIGGVKISSITFELSSRYEVQDSSESRMTRYFKLLNGFRGNRENHCSVEFRGPDGLDEAEFSFCYDYDGTLIATYDLYDNDDHSLNLTLDLPNKSSSNIGPEILDELIFDIGNMTGDAIYQALNYSILHCPRLQSLNIISRAFQFEDTQSSIKYEHRSGLISSDPTNSDINFLEIQFISPAQYYFDLVTTRLHNIKMISMETDCWGRIENDSVIDLTAFKKLTTFKYMTTIRDTSKNNEDNFVLLKYTNGENNYYYLDEEKRKNGQVEYTKNPTTPCLTIFCDASVSFDFLKLSY